MTAYLLKKGKNKFLSLFTAIPAAFLTIVVITYLLAEPNIALGRFIPYTTAVIIGSSISLLPILFYLYRLFFAKPKKIEEPKKENPIEEELKAEDR